MDSKAKDERLDLETNSNRNPKSNPSNKGKATAKPSSPRPLRSVAKKTVDRAVVVIDGMTNLYNEFPV
jgi:hypothetical protein